VVALLLGLPMSLMLSYVPSGVKSMALLFSKPRVEFKLLLMLDFERMWLRFTLVAI